MSKFELAMFRWIKCTRNTLLERYVTIGRYYKIQMIYTDTEARHMGYKIIGNGNSKIFISASYFEEV